MQNSNTSATNKNTANNEAKKKANEAADNKGVDDSNTPVRSSKPITDPKERAVNKHYPDEQDADGTNDPTHAAGDKKKPSDKTSQSF